MIYPNRGFTGGNNAVIRPALESDDPPEYVLLLNADTIVQEHALDALVAFMDAHPGAGIAGSMLTLAGRRASRHAVPLPGDRHRAGPGPAAGDRLEAAVALEHRCSPSRTAPAGPAGSAGASLILRRAMLEQIGLLDEGLYTYFDDPDICLRAARAGWETWYVPESRIIHLGGAIDRADRQRPAESRRPAYWFQARRRYFLKNHGAVVHGAGGRGVHPRLRGLAAAATDPAQAGHRPAPPADRLDPPQRLLRRLRGPRGREPGACEAAMHPEGTA